MNTQPNNIPLLVVWEPTDQHGVNTAALDVYYGDAVTPEQITQYRMVEAGKPFADRGASLVFINESESDSLDEADRKSTIQLMNQARKLVERHGGMED